MRVLDLLFPPQCTACGAVIRSDAKNAVFCGICHAKWLQAKRITEAEHAGIAVRRYTGITDPDRAGSVIHAVSYVPGARQSVEYQLIMRLKNAYDRRCADFVSDELCELIRKALPELTGRGDVKVTWIPRRLEAVRRHGFDHMERTAKMAARKLGIPSEKLLRRTWNALEQKQLDAAERHENALSTIHIAPKATLDGITVVLLDDIVTTGASLEAGAKELLGAGASQVIAVTLAATTGKRRLPRIEDGFLVTGK